MLQRGRAKEQYVYVRCSFCRLQPLQAGFLGISCRARNGMESVTAPLFATLDPIRRAYESAGFVFLFATLYVLELRVIS